MTWFVALLKISSETLAKAVEAPEFFAELMDAEETAEQKAAAERKRAVANQKRRAKYHRNRAAD